MKFFNLKNYKESCNVWIQIIRHVSRLAWYLRGPGAGSGAGAAGGGRREEEPRPPQHWTQLRKVVYCGEEVASREHWPTPFYSHLYLFWPWLFSGELCSLQCLRATNGARWGWTGNFSIKLTGIIEISISGCQQAPPAQSYLVSNSRLSGGGDVCLCVSWVGWYSVSWYYWWHCWSRKPQLGRPVVTKSGFRSFDTILFRFCTLLRSCQGFLPVAC